MRFLTATNRGTVKQTPMTNKELINRGIAAGQFPRFLYKFFPINDYFIDEVKNSYIWFSKPPDFNDPFDGSITLQWKATTEQYEVYLTKIAIGRMSEEKIKESSRRMSQNPEVAKAHLQDLVSKVMDRIGVTCLSEINDNILMWSHYANSHKGVCIQFDLGKMVSDDHILVRINYDDNYPLHNFITQGDNPTGLSKAVIGTKSSLWSYEREFRLISGVIGRNSIQRDSVTQVIFGCRSTEERMIIDLFNSNGYRPSYLKTYKKDSEFGLDIKALSY